MYRNWMYRRIAISTFALVIGAGIAASLLCRKQINEKNLLERSEEA